MPASKYSQKRTKALVVDSSGIAPIMHSLDEGDFVVSKCNELPISSGIDLYYDRSSTAELSFQPGFQTSLFEMPLSTSNPVPKHEEIYLSDTGTFSSVTFRTDWPTLKNAQYDHDYSVVYQASLWQTSVHWKRLSMEDVNIINTAHELKRAYGEVAILSNDGDLRKQCGRFEGISVYGTCSMLAGMVLNRYMNYQKATYIHSTWAGIDLRWVPRKISEPSGKRVMKFGEILDIERRRLKNKKSFWTKA